MKVLCIDDINKWGKKTRLIIGKLYTASQCNVYPENYDILELPEYYGHPVSYGKRHFIPISDIDETEMIRESIKQTV